MLRSTTSSRVRRHAASAGSAAFLFPAGTTVPDSGVAAFDDELLHCADPFGSRRGYPASTRGPAPDPRDEAWELFCEWTESDSLRKHVLGVEAAMVAYAREFGEDEELCAVTGLLHDLDYERYPDLDTRPPAHGAQGAARSSGYPQELIDAVAGHADFLGVPRETRWPRRCSPSTSCPASSPPCALSGPTGIHGHDAQVGEEEAEAAELRRRR